MTFELGSTCCGFTSENAARCASRTARPIQMRRRHPSASTLLLPRIVRWIHEIDILGAYTVKLDDGFFARPGEVVGLGLDDYGATGGVTP